jgi:hypothetical protein
MLLKYAFGVQDMRAWTRESANLNWDPEVGIRERSDEHLCSLRGQCSFTSQIIIRCSRNNMGDVITLQVQEKFENFVLRFM